MVARDQAEIPFTDDPEANRLIRTSPLAFLLGLLFDQQIPSRRAWAAPSQLMRRLGHLDCRRIASMPLADLQAVFSRRPALHRFPRKMAQRIQMVCRELEERYNGDPSRIWLEAKDAHELRSRLKALPGIGSLKARAATAIVTHLFGLDLPGKEAYPFACKVPGSELSSTTRTRSGRKSDSTE